MLDTCGNESQKSAYHKTIHLQINSGVNLSWSAYEGFSYTYYRILRDTAGNGNWKAIECEVYIYNVVAEEVFQTVIRNPEKSGQVHQSVIDLSNQLKGIYFVQVKSGEKVQRQKIILQ